MDHLASLPPTRRADLAIDRAAVRRAMSAGALVPLRRGVVVGKQYVADAELTVTRQHLLQVQIASAATRGSALVACLGTAALFHGLDRVGRPPDRVRLYKERGGQWRDERVVVLVCGLPAEDVISIHGVRATSLERTAVDLARWVSFRSGVVVMDSALNHGASREEVASVLARCAHWPGVRRARDVLGFANRGGTSVLESVSRVSLAEAKLPVARLQVPIFDGRELVGVVDFLWPDEMVVGEADGLVKYRDTESLRREKLRQEHLESLGYAVVRWTWDDIWRRPGWVAARIRAALERSARCSA